MSRVPTRAARSTSISIRLEDDDRGARGAATAVRSDTGAGGLDDARAPASPTRASLGRSRPFAAGGRRECARTPRRRVRRDRRSAPVERGRIRGRAHRRLSDPLPAVRRGPRPGSAVASGLPGELHHRVAAARRRIARLPCRTLAITPGDRAARASRVHGRQPPCGAVQRPAVRASGRAARGFVRHRRPRRARRPAGSDDATGRRIGRERISYARPRRRAARRGLRARPRLHAGRARGGKADAGPSTRRGR